MPGFISVADASALLGVSDRRVRVLCEEGRIPGAQKVGPQWIIPADPKVTEAGRVRPGKVALSPPPKKRGRPRKVI